jgi:muconate cycloisomerase
MKTIRSVEVFPVGLPMTKSFRFASGSAGQAGEKVPHVFVKITDSDGGVGWGEGRPAPQWSYETQESVTSTIRNYLAPAIIGLPITDRHGLHERMFKAVGRGPSLGQPIAKAAIDLAVHDLAARAAGQTLRSYLGGSDTRDTVALSYTLTGHDREEVRDDIMKARAQGFVHFNFKAAVTPATDCAVAEAVKEFASPEAFIWADANQGFKLHEARAVAREFARIGVHVLEQPLPADQIHLMRELRRDCPLPLAVDEATVGPADFFHYAAEGLVDFLVVKITRSGGLWPSLQQIAVAQSAGLPLLLSGLTDGLLTKMAACQLVAAFGYNGPAALNGSQFIDELALFPQKVQIECDGVVRLGTQPGIGVQPDEGALRRLLI